MASYPWLQNYDKGVPSHIEYPEIPLYHYLGEAAKKWPDRPCTIFKGAKISYKEMNDLTDQLAAGFHAEGIKKGDRVGIFIPNTPQFVIAYYALLKIGAIIVATNPLYTTKEIEYQVNDAGVEVMVLMTNNYEKMAAIKPRTKIRKLIVTNIKEALPPLLALLFTLFKEKKGGFRVSLQPGDIWMKDLIAKYRPEDCPKVDIHPDNTVLLQYSGGTTGISKGVIATHKNLVSNTLQIEAWNPKAVAGEEVILMAIPLYHAYGMIVGMNYGIKLGAPLVMVPNPRDIKDVLDNLQKFHATIFPGVPALYNAINNHPDVISGKFDLSSIKSCLSGSAPLLRETKEKFEKISGGILTEGYGLSEAPVATHCNPTYGENRTGSIGMPLPDVISKIVDIESGVADLAPGEVGELVLKGPQVMQGYYNMPTETANAIRGGWLFTGDIAYMDKDGYFYIVDRKKELIKPGGFQVWPREVEEAIQLNPKVLEVGVAGVPDSDNAGEAVKAWVVLKKGQTATESDIIAWCKDEAQGLARYKVPKHVEFIDELPKSTVGKTLRRELVRMHMEAK